MIDAFNRLIKPLENKIEKIACQHDPNNLYLLKTIPGVGQILALTILYEVHDIKRFKTVQRFCSYAGLIRPEKESDGKWAGKSNKKIGNAHLKWAIRTAAMISLRESEQAKKFVDRLSRKYNKGKALGIYTHKLGRSIFFMLKNKKAFDMKQFFSQ
jgi:transposase